MAAGFGSPSVDKPFFPTFDCDPTQDTASVGPRIDPDAVCPNLHLRADGVAMHNYEAMVGFVEQKRLSNPAQVSLALLIDFHSGTNSSVDEKIVSKSAAIVEALEKLHVSLGDRLSNAIESVFVAQAGKAGRIHSITLKALGPAKQSPFRDQFGFSCKNSQKNLFMISKEKDCSNAALSIGSEPFDDLSRTWPAVDQITDENEKNPARRSSGDVGMDFIQELLEQVEAAMDVANSIGSPPARTDGPSLPSRSETEHAVPLTRFSVREV